MSRLLPALVGLVLVGALGWGIWTRLEAATAPPAARSSERAPAPVEVGVVEQGSVRLRRTFSGALEASAEFVAAPKVAGQLLELKADLGDPIQRGQVVARLDDEEFVQAVAQARADLAVAEASRAEAESGLAVAERELERIETLRGEGVSSESQLDAARAVELSRRAQLAVARARVTRAEAALESARIRAEYTRVVADWAGGDDRRVVGTRFVDEGGEIGAGTPLFSIVELDPASAVIFVPERDYALLEAGQEVELVTDAFPGAVFEGEVERIAPVFRRSTRQARVEIRVENADERLKPGMFVRATIELRRVPQATVIPFAALTVRDDATGVFLLDDTQTQVAFVPVEVGVREGQRVQVLGADLSGFVVTLGQELCSDGARVVVTNEDELSSTGRPRGALVGSAEAPDPATNERPRDAGADADPAVGSAAPSGTLASGSGAAR